MQILATISDMSRLGIVLDLESGAIADVPVRPGFIDASIQGRAPCRPFGITWHGDELFVANNRQLLVFDKQLEFKRTMGTPLQVNTHQLAFCGSYVWAVSPWTNSLIGICPSDEVMGVEFDILEQKLLPYASRRAPENDDKRHFNSLLWTEDHVYISAHNFDRPSFILGFCRESLKIDSILENAGFAIHGLALHEEQLFWISSMTNEIRSSSGYSYRLSRQGYARGFAVTAQYFIVAISESRSRNKRSGGDSWIQVIDRQSGAVAGEFYLADTGSVNDLRLLDECDYAHGVAPFW